MLALPLLAACGGHPSDDACIRSFHRHRAAFERLRTMLANETEMTSVTEDTVRTRIDMLERERSNDTELRSRMDEYLRLIEELDVIDAVRLRSSVVDFRLSVTGQMLRGSIKSLIYMEDEPTPLLESLDDVGAVRIACKGCTSAYRKIDRNWYLRLAL